MKFTTQEKVQILRDIETNVALAYSRAIDIMDKTLEKIAEEKTKALEAKFEKVSEEMLKKVSVMKPADGKNGLTPQKYKDYFTPADISLIADKVKPIKGIDYRDGKDGKDGKNGRDGIGSDGKDGKDGKDGSPDKPLEIANKLNTTEESVDMKVIKGLKKTFADLYSSLRDRPRGTPSTQVGGGMGKWIHQQSAVTSATTTVTLANRVAGNGTVIFVRYQGQLLAHAVQYTVSGKVVTFVGITFENGTYVDISYVRT